MKKISAGRAKRQAVFETGQKAQAHFVAAMSAEIRLNHFGFN